MPVQSLFPHYFGAERHSAAKTCDLQLLGGLDIFPVMYRINP